MPVENKKRDSSFKLISKYQDVFGSKNGEEVLRHIVKDCGLLASTFRKDSNEMAYHEGRRSVALGILKILKTDVEKVKKLIEDIEKENDNYEN